MRSLRLELRDCYLLIYQASMGYWEVQLGGQWKSLGRVVGEACKDAKARGAKQVKFKARGSEYVIDFDQLTQTNIATGKSRPIRLRSYKQHGDPHVTVHNPPPSAPPSAPPADAKSDGWTKSQVLSYVGSNSTI